MRDDVWTHSLFFGIWTTWGWAGHVWHSESRMRRNSLAQAMDLALVLATRQHRIHPCAHSARRSLDQLQDVYVWRRMRCETRYHGWTWDTVRRSTSVNLASGINGCVHSSVSGETYPCVRTLPRDELVLPRIRAQCAWLAGSLVVTVGEEPSAVASRQPGRKQTSGEGLYNTRLPVGCSASCPQEPIHHLPSTSHQEFTCTSSVP